MSSKKDAKGSLKICEKSLHFCSNSSIHLIIPLAKINSVETKSKKLAIETDKGEIVLNRFSDIEETKDRIQSVMDKGAGGKVKI